MANVALTGPVFKLVETDPGIGGDEPPLSPDDAQRFVQVYEDLITSGDRDAHRDAQSLGCFGSLSGSPKGSKIYLKIDFWYPKFNQDNF